MKDYSNPENLYIDPSTSVFPVNLYQIFKNGNPVALEIGFGEGEFIVDLAFKNSNWNFVGIEIKRGRFNKALKKAKKHDIQNLRLVNIEAEIALKQVFAKNAFQAAYINFPDPWPKNRHSKHRLFNKEFIKELSKVMSRNGKAIIKTDHMEYISHIINEFNTSGLYCSDYCRIGFEAYEKNLIETKFEKEFKKEGRKIYKATFTNISD